jgi:hypothetical protein
MERTEATAILEKIGFLVRFWELKARHATLGEPLTGQEQLELLSLMQLVTGDFKMPEPGPPEAFGGVLPAQLIGEGTILTVEIREVTAAALLVAGLRNMSVGEGVIVRAADPIGGVEYALPCTVAWVHEGAPCTMALVVDGIPTRADFGGTAEVPVRSVLALGRQERFVG